jgi:L-amino acid N-acyltransferase YncA
MPRKPDGVVTSRAAATSDATAIAAIYNHYVTETTATFEEEPVTAEEIVRRIDEVRSEALPWLVAEEVGRVVGYAYATRWRARSAYRFSAEVTVYVAEGLARRGIGSKLYGELFPILQAQGVHAVMGGIALPNEASVALHERFGMRKAAHFEEVGFKLGKWIDVGYWQRVLR